MNQLLLITLPIGNNKDITYRAMEMLQKTRVIYAEDTRVLKEFLKHNGVDYSEKRIASFHDHSGETGLGQVLKTLSEESCAIVSDAGSPIISDPAYPIVRAAIDKGISIDSCSGISAVTCALELSGLMPIPFHFHGFLAREKGKIKQEFEMMKIQYGTHIFFEGKSRVLSTLDLLSQYFPEAQVCLGRELTKEYQSLYYFTGKEFEQIKSDIRLKGEFVILVENKNKNTHLAQGNLQEIADEILEKGARPKLVAKLIAEIQGKTAKEIYQLISKE